MSIETLFIRPAQFAEVTDKLEGAGLLPAYVAKVRRIQRSSSFGTEPAKTPKSRKWLRLDVVALPCALDALFGDDLVRMSLARPLAPTDEARVLHHSAAVPRKPFIPPFSI